MLKKSLVSLLSFGLALFLLKTPILVADSNTKSGTPNPPEVVRARIGAEIQAGTERRPAKGYERVQAADKFRVYALPETQAAYVYAVFADQKTVELLNPSAQTPLPPAALLLLPGCEEWYAFEALGPLVTLTLISSATPLPELEALLKTPQNLSAWRDMEKNLLAQSKLELSTAALKPYVLAGGARDCNSATNDAFLADLKISSGKGMVIKKYEFHIQE